MRVILFLGVQFLIILQMGCGDNTQGNDSGNYFQKDVAINADDELASLKKIKIDAIKTRDEIKKIVQETKQLKDEIDNLKNQIDIQPLRGLADESRNLNDTIDHLKSQVTIQPLEDAKQEAERLVHQINQMNAQAQTKMRPLRQAAEEAAQIQKQLSLVHDLEQSKTSQKQNVASSSETVNNIMSPRPRTMSDASIKVKQNSVLLDAINIKKFSEKTSLELAEVSDELAEVSDAVRSIENRLAQTFPVILNNDIQIRNLIMKNAKKIKKLEHKITDLMENSFTTDDPDDDEDSLSASDEAGDSADDEKTRSVDE